MASHGSGNIIRALIMLGLVLLIGTAGYVVIEGWQILDAIYMTVITITTVGYGEVRTVSPTGRVFTLALICMGMGIIAYTLGMVAQVMVELQVRSILGRKRLGLKIKGYRYSSLKIFWAFISAGRSSTPITSSSFSEITNPTGSPSLCMYSTISVIKYSFTSLNFPLISF